jgi:hypothetical protein
MICMFVVIVFVMMICGHRESCLGGRFHLGSGLHHYAAAVLSNDSNVDGFHPVFPPTFTSRAGNLPSRSHRQRVAAVMP